MAKQTKQENMELHSLKLSMDTMNRRMEEVVTMLGGNASYGVKGLRTEVKELREIVDKLQKIEQERWNLSLKTVPQKFIAVIGAIILILSAFSSIKELFLK